MTATALKQPDLVVGNVRDARHRLAAAEERVELLCRRVDTVEARAMATRAERAKHQSQVTAALVEGGELPQALPPPVIEPD